MFKQIIFSCALVFLANLTIAHTFSGIVKNSEGNPLANVEVYLLEDDAYAYTNAQGVWSFESDDSNPKTIVFHKEGFTYEQLVNKVPSVDFDVILRSSKLSYASLRELDYKVDGCSSVNIPDNPEWNVTFKITELKGDLAPDPNYTRRDPSAVVKINGTYYVWYSYSLTYDNNKIAPWDLNDIYYSTSVDGITWEEQGIAVGRGDEGAFDARSVFTTEIFVYGGKYYLVYQAAADLDGIYNRNTVGMAVAESPDGPWTKLDEPILRPTYTNDPYFDNNAVHDPCLISYNNKFYLYYKGECNCRGAAGCVTWCNPICGLNKQVKWGVAVADNPTGPFVKSEYNPITNTGHEVMVWPYKDGVSILQHQDGPEALSIQYASDGFNFEIKGQVANIPEAAGLFRADKSDTNPHAGIKWGVGHQLKWNAGPKGWMYIYRFDIVSTEPTGMNIIPDKIQIGKGQTRSLSVKMDPINASVNNVGWTSNNESVATVDAGGTVTGLSVGEATVAAENSNAGLSDNCKVVVQEDPFVVSNILVSANSFNETGGTFDDSSSGGPGFGVNKTGTGINFVNKEDWCTYSVNVPEKGVYELSYQISTPTNNPEVTMQINGVEVASDKLYTNGYWDSYYKLLATNLLVLDKTGDNSIKLIASGTDAWQWNLKSFSYTRLCDLNGTVGTNTFLTNHVEVFSDPEKGELHINGLDNEYKVWVYSMKGVNCYYSSHFGNATIDFGIQASGVYLVKILQSEQLFTTKVLL